VARVDNRGNLRGSAQNRTVGNQQAVGIRGADEFLRLSKRLKEAGETELRKELHKAVRVAAKPLIPAVRAAGREAFPQRGGLARRMGKKPYRSQARTGARTAGVRIVGTQVDPRMNAEGRIWHPVFGRTGKPKSGGRNSVVQDVPAVKGYFDKTLTDAAPEVRAELIRVVASFADRIV